MPTPICRAPECGNRLSTEAEQERRYCDDCWDEVWAFQPNSDIDDWHFVAEDMGDRLAGDGISGDQCGNCGGSGWVFARNAKGQPVVRCSRDETYDLAEGDVNGPSSWVGCHSERPIRRKHSYEVIF